MNQLADIVANPTIHHVVGCPFQIRREAHFITLLHRISGNRKR